MKVLCFGSLNLDIVFAVERFVRAGETISSKERTLNAGGKGLNQSVALAKAGAEVYHAGNIGSDGKLLIDTLRENGVNTDYIRTVDGVSGQAIIQVDKTGQNCIMLYDGANTKVDSEQIDTVLANFGAGDTIVLQNEINRIPEIIEKAKAKGMRVALNPSPVTIELMMTYPLHLVDVFLVNEIEGEALSHKTKPEDIVKVMNIKYPDAEIVLTLGKDGVLYYDGINTYKQEIYKVVPADTTAAGDTFTGYFLRFSQEVSIPEALRIATVASGIAVSKEGAAKSIPTRDVVLAVLK